jgi:hypothetical protein
MKKINKQLKDSLNSGLPHIVEMIQPMQEKYYKYWTQMEDLAVTSQVFDTQSKLQRIEFILLEELSNDQATTSINRIKSILSTWFEDVISNRNKNISNSLIPEENALFNQNDKGPTLQHFLEFLLLFWPLKPL